MLVFVGCGGVRECCEGRRAVGTGAGLWGQGQGSRCGEPCCMAGRPQADEDVARL